MLPLRRAIPGLFGLDFASLVPAWLLQAAVKAAMLASGWSDKLPSQHMYGGTINRDGVAVNIEYYQGENRLRFKIYGECRNVTNHYGDSKNNGTNLTKELNSDS